MRSLFSATAVAALVVGGGFFFAVPADATTLMAVFTGTFDYIDGSLREGNQNIPFTATFLYDPSLGSEVTTTPFDEEISGGTQTGDVSPIISATFTAHTAPGAPSLDLIIPGDQNGSIAVGQYTIGNHIQLRVDYVGDLGAGFDSLHGFYIDFISPNLTMDPSQLFVSSPGDFGDGAMETEPFYSDPQLFADSLTITALPEPATWAMFLVGFGAIGFMLRRSFRKVAAAVA